MPTTRSQSQKRLSSETRPTDVASGQEVCYRTPLKKTGLPTSRGKHWTNEGTAQTNRSVRQDYDDNDDELDAQYETAAALSSDEDFTDGEDYSSKSSVYEKFKTRDARSSGGKKLDISENKNVSFGESKCDDMRKRQLLKKPDRNVYSDTSSRSNVQNRESFENKFSWGHASILHVLVLCLCLVVGYGFYTTNVSVSNTYNTELAKGILSLKIDFPSQESQFWDMVESTVDNHLAQGSSPNGPIVFLFGSHRDASDTTKCLATKLENFLSKALQEKNPSVTIIDGKTFEKQDADDAKLNLDNRLEDAFKKGQKAAVILNLDALPPCSVLLFHSYCENESARYKNVALIFTVTLSGSFSSQHPDATRSKPLNLKNKEADLISQHLNQVWVGKCKFLAEEKVEALLSRVANNVGIIRKENMLPC